MNDKNMAAIRAAAEALVQQAELAGVVVTIETVPAKPLAMGCYGMQVGVRVARDRLVRHATQAGPVSAPCLISVDVFALAHVLQALAGPEHLIREMQATRRLHKLGYPNPIETLLDQVNAWAEEDAKKGGAA